jgi:hypothetical protein
VIRAQIETLIDPALPLSMFPAALNEFMSINNVEAFAAHFNVSNATPAMLTQPYGSILAPNRTVAASWSLCG